MQGFRWLLLISLVAAYSLDDPTTDHTAKAIELDTAGDRDGALRSFSAAVRFSPANFRNRHNLAVAFMRAGHGYGRNSNKARHFYTLAHQQFTAALDLPHANERDRQASRELLQKMTDYFERQHGRPFAPDPAAISAYDVSADGTVLNSDGIKTTAQNFQREGLNLPLHSDGSSLFWRGSASDVQKQEILLAQRNGKTSQHDDTIIRPPPKKDLLEDGSSSSRSAIHKSASSTPDHIGSEGLERDANSKLKVPRERRGVPTSSVRVASYEPKDAAQALPLLRSLNSRSTPRNVYHDSDDDSFFGREWSQVTKQMLQTAASQLIDPLTGARPLLASASPLIVAWDELASVSECEQLVEFFDRHMNKYQTSETAEPPWCFSDYNWAAQLTDSGRLAIHETDPVPVNSTVAGITVSQLCFQHPASIDALSSVLPRTRAIQKRRAPDFRSADSVLDEIAKRLAAIAGLPQVYLAPPKIVEYSTNGPSQNESLACGNPEHAENDVIFSVHVQLTKPRKPTVEDGGIVFPHTTDLGSRPILSRAGRAIIWRNLVSSSIDGDACDRATKFTVLPVVQGRSLVLELAYHQRPPIRTVQPTTVLCTASQSCQLVVPEFDDTVDGEETLEWSASDDREAAEGTYRLDDPYMNHRAHGIAAGVAAKSGDLNAEAAALESFEAAVLFSNTYKDHANLALALRRKFLRLQGLRIENDHSPELRRSQPTEEIALCQRAFKHLHAAATSAPRLEQEEAVTRILHAMQGICNNRA